MMIGLLYRDEAYALISITYPMSCIININGPIHILVIYQDSGMRDIKQEWQVLGTFFFIDFCNTIHKTNTGQDAFQV